VLSAAAPAIIGTPAALAVQTVRRICCWQARLVWGGLAPVCRALNLLHSQPPTPTLQHNKQQLTAHPAGWVGRRRVRARHVAVDRGAARVGADAVGARLSALPRPVRLWRGEGSCFGGCWTRRG
jgi:hypothetical protein